MINEFCCYHVTTKDRLLSILKDGLKPNAEPNWFISKTPYIMLSLYPYWWLYKDAVLIEINDPSIKPEYFNDPEGLRWGYNIATKHFNAVVEFHLNEQFEKSRGRRESMREKEPFRGVPRDICVHCGRKFTSPSGRDKRCWQCQGYTKAPEHCWVKEFTEGGLDEDAKVN